MVPNVIAAVLQRVGLRQAEHETKPDPGEIALAREELTRDAQPDEAMIGRARLEDLGGEYATDPKAVIPLHLHDPYEDPAPLTFDVDGDQLQEFCEALGGTVDSVGQLNGKTIPVRWVQGHPEADWLSLLEPETADDGRESA
jgi:hypothetical protein